MKISFIGAGNVATHLSIALSRCGHEILGVHTRTVASAQAFAAFHHCRIAATLDELPASDLYIFSIKDDALREAAEDFGRLKRKGLCIHTAGSVPMDIFAGNVERYGVLYPLQTFSKNRKVDFSGVPLFIESNNAEDRALLLKMGREIANEVYEITSDQRKDLHLAAVFACNFSNHCFAIAGKIMEKSGLQEKLLIPLIQETCNKLKEMPAVEGQTGPAVRYDKKIMETQLSAFAEDELRANIYKAMSESIHDYAINHTDNL